MNCFPPTLQVKVGQTLSQDISQTLHSKIEILQSVLCDVRDVEDLDSKIIYFRTIFDTDIVLPPSSHLPSPTLNELNAELQIDIDNIHDPSVIILEDTPEEDQELFSSIIE